MLLGCRASDLVCSLENVFVYGTRKRMYSSDGFYLREWTRWPHGLTPEERVFRKESTSVISCVGHAVLSRNAMGTACRPKDSPHGAALH